MYRHCKTIRVANMWLGKAAPQTFFAVSRRCCSSGVSKIEQLLLQTDKFPSRHIGINPQTEQEMTNFLGLEVDYFLFYILCCYNPNCGEFLLKKTD